MGPPNPAIVDQAQHLKVKLDSLDAEFKTHHYAVVDTISDEGEQAKEQSELDQHDHTISELCLRLQNLVTAHSTFNQENQILQRRFTQLRQDLQQTRESIKRHVPG